MMKTNIFLFLSLLITSAVYAEEAPIAAEQSAKDSSAAVVEQATTKAEQNKATLDNNNIDNSATDSAKEIQSTSKAAAENLPEQSGYSRGSVMRSTFTNGIENREPIDDMNASGNKENNITYFSELRDMSGQVAKHRWEHNGNVMAEVEFNVRGPRWRVWSSKALMPEWQGEWKVSVLNSAGEVISEELVNYKNIAAAPEAAAGTDITESSSPAEQSSETQP